MDLPETEPLVITNSRRRRMFADDFWIGRDRALSWTIAVAILLINFIVIGLGRMSSILYVDFIREFKVNRKLAAAPFSVQQSTRNLFGPVVGLLGHKFGIRAVTIVGGLIGAFSCAACAYAKDMLLITVFWGAFYGIAIAFTSTLGQIILDEYFVKYLSTASGLSFAGGSLGTMIFSLVLQKTIDLYGLSNTFIIMGVITIFAVPLAITLAKPPPWVTVEKEYPSSKRKTGFIKGRFFVVDSFWPVESLKSTENNVTDDGEIKNKSSVIVGKHFEIEKEDINSSQDAELNETDSVDQITTLELETDILKKCEYAIAHNECTDKTQTDNPVTAPLDLSKISATLKRRPITIEEKDSHKTGKEDTKIAVDGQALDIEFSDSEGNSDRTLCSNVSEYSIHHQVSEGSLLGASKSREIPVKIIVEDDSESLCPEVSLTDRASQEMLAAEKLIEEGRALDASFVLSRSEELGAVKHLPDVEKRIQKTNSKFHQNLESTAENIASEINKISVSNTGIRLISDTLGSKSPVICFSEKEFAGEFQTMSEISLTISDDSKAFDSSLRSNRENNKGCIEKQILHSETGSESEIPNTREQIKPIHSKMKSTIDARQNISPTIEDSKKSFVVEKYVLKKVKELQPAMIVTANECGRSSISKRTDAIQQMVEVQEKSDNIPVGTRKVEGTDEQKLGHAEENSEDELTFRSKSPMPSPEAVKEFAVKKFLKKKIESEKSSSFVSSSATGEAPNDSPYSNENKGAKPKISPFKRMPHSLGGNKKKCHKGSCKNKALISGIGHSRPMNENPSFDAEFGEFLPQQGASSILGSGLDSIEGFNKPFSSKTFNRSDEYLKQTKCSPSQLLETYSLSNNENFPDKYSSKTKNDNCSLFINSIQSLNIGFLRQHVHDVILVLNIKCVAPSTDTFYTKLNYGSICSIDRKFLKELEELFISIERERYDLYLNSQAKSRDLLCTMCKNLVCGERNRHFNSEERKIFRKKSNLYPRLRDIFKKNDRYLLSHFDGEKREHFKKLVYELRALYDYVKEPLTLSSQQITLQEQNDSSRCWPPFISQVIFKLYLNPAFLVICLSRAVHLMTFMGVLTFIVDFSLDRRLEENDARYSVTLMSLGDLLGRLCTGWITDNMFISLERYMLLVMGLIGVISVSLPYLPPDVLLFFVCFYSVLQGSVFIRHPVLVSKYTNANERTVGMGFMTLFSGLLGLLMPFYIGYYRDVIGTYNDIFFINGGICFGIGLLWMSPLKRYEAEVHF